MAAWELCCGCPVGSAVLKKSVVIGEVPMHSKVGVDTEGVGVFSWS
jgi:hypothetical protein